MFPKCSKCNVGMLVPLSDYGPDGAAILVKAWACSNHTCKHVMRIDKGTVSYSARRED